MGRLQHRVGPRIIRALRKLLMRKMASWAVCASIGLVQGGPWLPPGFGEVTPDIF